MTTDPNRDLPPSAFDAAKAESRDLAIWTADAAADARNRFAPAMLLARRFMPHALIACTALVATFAVAGYATGPSLTDGMDEIAAIDARSMGLATDLDASGALKKQAALGRDVGAMKAEIVRLQRVLDQSKANQTTFSKTAAGQAAANQDEVRSLKTEIATLNKTLDATKTEAASKIAALEAKVDQPKADDGHIAELRDRLDRIEKAGAPAKTAARDAGPETTGSVSKPTAAGDVVRDWVVRDVSRGVALLESRGGRMIEVVRGARPPAIGRIRSIERRDGEWVVVSERGVILER